jgi:peptidoglycan/xylan/chitin deacetylase (PgdA/CDA1 family)
MARPRFGSVPYGVDLTSCTVPGKIALTFDDGPCEYTSQVLDVLEANGVHGTFFLVGTNGDAGISSGKYTGVLKRMLANGHQLGSHSWSHADFNTISYDEKLQEILKNEQVFADTLGIVPTYFRPPYTDCNGECIGSLGELAYHVTDYDLDTKDWENGGAASKDIYAGAIAGSNPSRNSFIVLAHDIQPFTVNGFVQWMIDQARQKGYEFTTLGECLGDPAANWYRDPKTGEPAGSAPKPDPPKPTPTTTSTTSSTTSTTSSTPTTTSTSTTTTSSTLSTSTTSAPSTSKTVTPPVARVSPTKDVPSPSKTAPAPSTVTKSAAAGVGGVGNTLLGALFGVVACILLL